MPSQLESTLVLLLKVSWQGAVLILLVLAAQWAFRRRLHPRWRYALWLLVLVRLGLPWTVASRASLFNVLSFSLASPVLEPASRSGSREGVAGPPPATLASASAGPGSVLTPPTWGRSGGWRFPLAAALWALGVVSLGGYLAVTHLRLARRLARHRPVTDPALLDLLEDCKEEMGVRVPVTLLETREVGSPSLFGFVRPRLLLPSGLARSFSRSELRWVLLHELAHLKRRDILVGWLMTGLQLVHWFNPLVWLAFYRMRVERELACDALVLARAGEEEKQRYGQTIIRLLESFGRPALAPSLAGAVENRNQLKERIRMIASTKNKHRGPALALALLAGLGLITLTEAEPATAPLGPQLIGTWVLVGHPGQVGEPPAAGGRLKSFTDTQWSMTQLEPGGVVLFHHGGPYTLKGNEYTETVAFANESTKDRIGKTHKFRLKIEGDRLWQVGIDNHWQEVWQRVKANAPKPVKAEPGALQGTWHGHEAGVDGTSALTIRGSRLEFRGADTNEWYKADISLYDTTPKQMVVAITDCPFRQYVGVVSYAIYQLKDGILTITGNEPGAPTVPAGVDASGARKMVFKQD